MKKTVFSILFLGFFALSVAQEIILPLEVNASQAELYRENSLLENDKVYREKFIKVDTTQSKIIILDDFSYNKGTPGANYWQDNYVYMNNNFAKNPLSIGVVTFDGLDETGYPYNFTQSSSYGACDTLTSLPIQLSKVDYSSPNSVLRLSFMYQPQGINPFTNAEKDSIILQFKEKRTKRVYKTVIISSQFDPTDPAKNDTIVVSRIVDDSKWTQVWGEKGDEVYDFRQKIIEIDPKYYKDDFQFRFVSYGNTSGSVDHWHLDYVYLSLESEIAHEDFEDVAYSREAGSQLKEFYAMPWSHYYDDPDYYVDTSRMSLRMYNSYVTSVNVSLEYFAEDASGNQVDAITGVPGGVILFGSDWKNETMPIQGVSTHNFKFPITSEPNKNATTYFIKRNVMTNPDQNELIKENNTLKEYQVFGTYYSYDDGSAEAAYGVRGNGGFVAYQFNLKDGLSDTINSIYIYFNPVVVNRSSERFKFTIWDDNNGRPGNVIYQDVTVRSPSYPKEGVDEFQRIFLDSPFIVSDVYYIGYEKLSTEVLNIGYDLNTEARDKMFYNIGAGWKNSLIDNTVPKGSIMMRPSFSKSAEPQVGIQKIAAVKDALDVNIYPNPARDLVYLEAENYIHSVLEVRVVDLRGSIIESFIMYGSATFDASRLDPGLYLVQIIEKEEGLSLNKKIIVSR